MRVKQTWLSVSFSTTNDAMRFEANCPIEGRLIPLPTSLSSGCGLAWKSPLSLKMELLDYLSKETVVYEQVVEILL